MRRGTQRMDDLLRPSAPPSTSSALKTGMHRMQLRRDMYFVIASELSRTKLTSHAETGRQH